MQSCAKADLLIFESVSGASYASYAGAKFIWIAVISTSLTANVHAMGKKKCRQAPSHHGHAGKGIQSVSTRHNASQNYQMP